MFSREDGVADRFVNIAGGLEQVVERLKLEYLNASNRWLSTLIKDLS